MKKIIALIMSVVMCASLAIVAFAAEDTMTDILSGMDIDSMLSEDILNDVEISEDGTADITNVLSDLLATIILLLRALKVCLSL